MLDDAAKFYQEEDDAQPEPTEESIWAHEMEDPYPQDAEHDQLDDPHNQPLMP